MLGVGWTEMLVIGVVALIVIGPKDLPDLMNKIGRFAGSIRRMGQDFQRELNKTTGLDQVRNLRSTITAPLKATTDAIRKEFNATTASGTVEPSGALKPADPKAESVVNEIHAAAGMTPKPTPLPLTPKAAMEQAIAQKLAETAPAASAAAPVAAAPLAPVPVKAARPKPKAKPEAAPDPVPAAPKAAARKRVAKVESPAPVEAIAPAKPEKTAAAAPAAKRQRKATAAAPTEAPVPTVRKPARKPATTKAST